MPIECIKMFPRLTQNELIYLILEFIQIPS